MTNKITIGKGPDRGISVTTAAKSIIKISSGGAGGGGAGLLRQLEDVDATSLDNNETLVYDAASDKFIVETMPIVDGGTF